MKHILFKQLKFNISSLRRTFINLQFIVFLNMNLNFLFLS